MKVNISDIVKINGATSNIELSEVLEDLNILDENFSFNNPVNFTGSFTNINSLLLLEGHLEVEFSAVCYRCLKKVKLMMNVNIKENFVNSEKSSDIDDYTYSKNLVTIDKALIDNIILNLPMKQVCSVKCRGLCDKCGVNLNEKDCSCNVNEMNPQMEVLKNFFNN